MTNSRLWHRPIDCARTLVAGCFTNEMGVLNRVEPRMAAALRDLLARPGSVVRATVAYLLAIEMGIS